MAAKAIETDYLVIGAGAMGMAFLDTLVSESDTTAVVVDRYHRPGGHWTMAYPFVRLHQPSAAYGVNSRQLGNDGIDLTGWNKGLYELATAGEVCAYFDAVMQQQLLPTGRVSYFPMSEYQGDRRFRTFAGDSYEVNVKRRVVDTTYMKVMVPFMRPAPYHVVPEVRCVPPNELPNIRQRYPRYAVVGAGKTAMDTCQWLLWHGIEPGDITWIRPRDAWLINRAIAQFGAEFSDLMAAGIRAQNQAIMEAISIDDLFERLVARERLLRLDDKVRPTMFRCAVVSPMECEQLRRVRNVVRLGHVQHIEPNKIVLESGTIPTDPKTLHIDCSAGGLETRPAVPVFQDSYITVQPVSRCQQVFSAAFIAHIEVAYSDDSIRNSLCAPIPHPETELDWLRTTLQTQRAYLQWSEHNDLQEWLDNARLNLVLYLSPKLPTDPTAREQARRQRRITVEAVNEKLERLLLSARQGMAS
jgi:hypothetical protein